MSGLEPQKVVRARLVAQKLLANEQGKFLAFLCVPVVDGRTHFRRVFLLFVLSSLSNNVPNRRRVHRGKDKEIARSFGVSKSMDCERTGHCKGRVMMCNSYSLVSN